MQFGHTYRHLLAVNVKGGTAPNLGIIALVLLAVSITHAGGQSGEFQVELSRIMNPRGVAADGDCCDGTAVNGSCSSPCKTFFTVCLNQVSRQSTCTFGMITTKPVPKNSFDLPGNASLVRLPFRFSWPGFFTLEITAKHYLGQNSSKVIENIVIKQSLLPGTQWQNVTQGTNANVTFSFRVLCDKNYYGNSCAKFCSPRDDIIGHWTCDEMGNEICVPGWTGDFCSTALCPQGCEKGQCVLPGKCRCLVGWKGDQCNECKTYPGCVHGTCSLPWQCNCEDGWGGQACDFERNTCGKRTPCVKDNTKLCKNIGLGLYKCICKKGYGGPRCRTESNECLSRPCKNGASCTDLFADFSCTCPEGFKGKRCEQQECSSSTCKNEGTCVEGDANVTCVCPAQFTGRTCELMIWTTPTTDKFPGKADNSTGTKVPGSPGKSTKDVVIVVAPILGLIFIVCVVLMICCRKRIKLFGCFGRNSQPNDSQVDKETRNYENRDPEMLKDCDGEKQCRVVRPARTPEIIINFDPGRQTGKNVNHFQNSQREEEEKQWKERKDEEQDKEKEESIDETERRRRRELQGRERPKEEEEERRKDRQAIQNTDASGSSLELKDIRKATNPSMTPYCYEKGFWQDVELEI